MLDLIRGAVVCEAAGELPQDSRLLLRLVEQQRSGLGCDRATIETRHHFTPSRGGE
jgi:hypothetical protein